ncbi:unnamed protein product, partial [marine sediment metagenome]
GLFNMMFCSKQFRFLSNVDQIIEIASRSPKPIFFWLIGEDKEVRRNSELLAKNNLPSFSSLEDMVKNFWVLVQESNNKNKILNKFMTQN